MIAGRNKPSGFLYIVVTAWVFVLSLTVLNSVGFVPYYVDGSLSNKERAEVVKRLEEEQKKAEQEKLKPVETRVILPTRLTMPAFGVDLPLTNPNTTDVKVLNQELLTSIIRYPGSGTLGRDGNMLILGHSTSYRTVHNKMYQAFNQVPHLEEGNVIKLISGDKEYVYTVSNKEMRKASDAIIDFTPKPGVQQITLVTCNTLGKKADRWIVTADFVGSYPRDVSLEQ